MNYNKLVEEAHKNAMKHGFWDVRVSNEHCLMLTCTEIADIIEADRKGKHARCYMFQKEKDTPQVPCHVQAHWRFCFEQFIKDTVEDEFADTFIMLCDLAGELEVDFDKMNPCRYHRAFDRFTMTENAFGLVKGLSKGNISIHKRIQFGLDYIVNWAKYENINLEWYVRQKMQYNDGRPALHGKKY